MSKLYIIQQRGFDYNDNYMYESENQGGTPVTAYRSRHMAEIECRRMNLEEFKTCEVFNYGDSFHEYYGYNLNDELCLEMGIPLDNSNSEWTPVDLTDEQLGKFFDACTLRFYEVNAVEVQDD